MSLPQIRLLGAIEAHQEGAVLPIAGRRLQALLAVLAVDAGRTVPADLLATRAWGELPPGRVRANLALHS